MERSMFFAAFAGLGTALGFIGGILGIFSWPIAPIFGLVFARIYFHPIKDCKVGMLPFAATLLGVFLGGLPGWFIYTSMIVGFPHPYGWLIKLSVFFSTTLIIMLTTLISVLIQNIRLHLQRPFPPAGPNDAGGAHPPTKNQPPDPNQLCLVSTN